MEQTHFKERKRLLFFGLPLTFTTYNISEDSITIQSGLLNTQEDDCYMYKVQDVKLSTSLLQRIFRLSTITCFTGDVTDKELVLKNIKNGKEIKEYLLQSSERARLKRRTIHTNNIDADDIVEI